MPTPRAGAKASLIVKGDGSTLELADGAAVGASRAAASTTSATTVATPTAAAKATASTATSTTPVATAASESAAASATKAVAVLRPRASEVETDHARSATLSNALAIGLFEDVLRILNAVERDVSEALAPPSLPVIANADVSVVRLGS